MNMGRIDWWYWAVSWILIAFGLMGQTTAFLLVTFLAGIQIIHFGITERSLTAFPVQVRVAVFGLFAIGLYEPLRFIYWLPAFGLLARISVNYCLTARALSLLPWNRKDPLTWVLVQRTFLTRPTKGSIMDHKAS